MSRQADGSVKVDGTKEAECPPLITMPTYGETSLKSITGLQAAILVDSWLPYQRSIRTDLQKLAVELNLSDADSSESSEHNLAPELTSSTQSSSRSKTKSASPGQFTDDTTPEETFDLAKVTLRAGPPSVIPSNLVRRRSVSSSNKKAQLRSPTYADAELPHRSKNGLPQSKDRTGFVSTSKPRQQYQQYPWPTKESPPMSPDRTSRGQVITAHDLYHKPNTPPHSPYQSPTVQARYPDRARSNIETPLNDRPTRIREQLSLDSLLEPKFEIQSQPSRPTQSRAPRSADRAVSTEPRQSPLTINANFPVSALANSQRLRASPTPQHLMRAENSVSAPQLTSSDRRRRQSRASVVPPNSIPSSPAARTHEKAHDRNERLHRIWQDPTPMTERAALSTKRQTRDFSAWRPPSVWYENVDGVILSTRPKSAKESRSGLSIPEIEARDIRRIPHSASDIKRQPELDFHCEFADRERAYAPPPPAIGGSANRVRSIVPRPVTEPEDHVFLDNYSRAADDEMVNQRANPPRTRRSESFNRTKVSVPEVIRENPIAESETSADADVESTDSDAAIPPDVARSRWLYEQDVQMTSRKEQVKTLLGSMMKGLSGKADKVDFKYGEGHIMPDYRPLSDDPTASKNGESFYFNESDNQDDRTETGSSRPSTAIWSPPKAIGRYSEDYAWDRGSVLSNSSENKGSVYLPATAPVFASLGGPRR